jgi:hypothetical protein
MTSWPETFLIGFVFVAGFVCAPPHNADSLSDQNKAVWDNSKPAIVPGCDIPTESKLCIENLKRMELQR